MGLKLQANSGGGDYETIEQGSHAAVLVSLIDCGSRLKTFPGSPPKLTHEIYLCWELPGMVMSGTTRNHTIARMYTLSFHEKAGLRKLIEQWRGSTFRENEEFDLTTLVNKPCLLSVTHKTTNSGNTVAIIGGVMRLPNGMAAPKAAFPAVVYEVAKGVEPPSNNWLPKVWNDAAAQMVSIGEYVRNSYEWQGAPLPTAAPGPQPALAGAAGIAGTQEEPPF